MENMNPISDEDGGEDYVRPANMMVAGAEPPEPADPPAAMPDVEEDMDNAISRLKTAARG
jgi:hypothetical protein